MLGGKKYSRKLHSTATRSDNDIEIKLKLLKSILDKPVVFEYVFDSTVDNNLKVTNQVLRKSLSNLLEVQRKNN